MLHNLQLFHWTRFWLTLTSLAVIIFFYCVQVHKFSFQHYPGLRININFLIILNFSWSYVSYCIVYTCNILDTIMSCEGCHLLLKMWMYTCGVNGLMQGVYSKGMLTTLGSWGGASHMGQFNAGMRLEWKGLCLHDSSNLPCKLFTPYYYLHKQSYLYIC